MVDIDLNKLSVNELDVVVSIMKRQRGIGQAETKNEAEEEVPQITGRVKRKEVKATIAYLGQDKSANEIAELLDRDINTVKVIIAGIGDRTLVSANLVRAINNGRKSKKAKYSRKGLACKPFTTEEIEKVMWGIRNKARKQEIVKSLGGAHTLPAVYDLVHRMKQGRYKFGTVAAEALAKFESVNGPLFVKKTVEDKAVAISKKKDKFIDARVMHYMLKPGVTQEWAKQKAEEDYEKVEARKEDEQTGTQTEN